MRPHKNVFWVTWGNIKFIIFTRSSGLKVCAILILFTRPENLDHFDFLIYEIWSTGSKVKTKRVKQFGDFWKMVPFGPKVFYY